MKKTILVVMAVVFSIALIGTSAHAWKGGGFGSYAGNCPAYASVDPVKAQKFYSDTLPLRQKHLQLRGELAQLYAQPNPDWNAITKRQQEMLQLRTEIQKRAYENGLPYGNGKIMRRAYRVW